MKTELLKELRKKFAEYYKVVNPNCEKYKYAICYRGGPGVRDSELEVVTYTLDSGKWKFYATSDPAELKLMIRRLAHEFIERKIKELRAEEMNRKFIYPW